MFGDTAKLFEAINPEELKEKLESTMKDMEGFFDLSNLKLVIYLVLNLIKMIYQIQKNFKNIWWFIRWKIGNLKRNS